MTRPRRGGPVVGLLWLVALSLSLLPLVAVAQSPRATPSTPPALPGKGGRLIDPVYGTTIIQLTDGTDGTLNFHSYSSRSALNYDNTQVLLELNDTTWVARAFNPAALTVGADTPVPMATLGTALDPMMWDLSGLRNTRLYGAASDSTETGRRFWAWTVGDADVTILPNSTFATNLRVIGAVARAASPTSLTLTITEPITDMTPEFFVNQTLAFTSGQNAGRTAIISAFTHPTGATTLGACTPTACVPAAAGDAVYVAPAGYNSGFAASSDGRYLMVGVAHESGLGQDDPHILVVYDTQAQALTRVRYFSQADYGTGTGLHILIPDRTTGSTKVWMGLQAPVGATLLYDFATNVVTQIPQDSDHGDASADQRFLQNCIPCSNDSVVTRPVAGPTATTTVYIPPTKTYAGKTASVWLVDSHLSWVDSVQKGPGTFVYSGSLSFTPSLQNTGWVADGAPVYRFDNYLTFASANTLHLANSAGVNDNLGEVWDGPTVLTYVGNTKAQLVAAGQWAYDPTASAGSGSLWVRGATSEDLTLAANTGVIAAFDWRVGMDEILLVDISDPGNLTKYRQVCKTYNRPSVVGGVVTVDRADLRGSASPDGRFIVFTSTWGNRQQVDVFVAAVGQGTAAGTRPGSWRRH